MSEQAKGINWEDVKRRIAESRLGLEKALAAAPEQMETVYERRAQQLANRRVQLNAPATALRVLVFTLGEERYGLEFGDLAELLPFGNCTPVPGGPPQLLGVTNIHGEIRSVVDLARLLDLPAGDGADSGYVLLLRKNGRQVGLRVDRLDKIQFLAPEELAVPGEGEAGAPVRYVKGLARDRLRLLSTEAIFSHPIFKGVSHE